MVTYEAPNKAIITPTQLEQFQQSPTHSRVLGYLETLNEAVVGVKLRDTCHESEVKSRHYLLYNTSHSCVSCRPSGPSLEYLMMSWRLQSKRLQ
jgi:hypothetical protein